MRGLGGKESASIRMRDTNPFTVEDASGGSEESPKVLAVLALNNCPPGVGGISGRRRRGRGPSLS
eukprot:6400814-Lingulodinium_polyedra.AAC.1